MLNRLMLKVTKFQLPSPKRLGQWSKTFWGPSWPPCQIGLISLFDMGLFEPSVMGGHEGPPS